MELVDERDRTVDLLSAIPASVSRHPRTPPDARFYRRLDLSGFVGDCELDAELDTRFLNRSFRWLV